MTTKPFNLEEAKAGAKLVTRDGRPARIGIWDAPGGDPLIGYIQCHSGISIRSWRNNGQYGPDKGYDLDLLIVCEPKLRAWMPEEVPVGALLRPKSDYFVRELVTSVNQHYEQCITTRYGNNISVLTALELYEHSTDGGKTWKPAGIEE